MRPEVVAFSRNYNDSLVINKALSESKADREYYDAVKAFDKGDMESFLDNFFKAIHSRYDIEKPLVRRFIRSKLNVVNKLRAENRRLLEEKKEKDDFLKRLAVEYVMLGKECEKEKMNDAAIANYKKALKLCPDIPGAKRRLKRLQK